MARNPGTEWGGPIGRQGHPWEDFLDSQGAYGKRLPPNFRTFDFFDEDTGVATGAKTLDTRAKGYIDRPTRIYARLRRYVDQIETFDSNPKRSESAMAQNLKRRVLELAVPRGTSSERITQIRRAGQYAADRDVSIITRFVE